MSVATGDIIRLVVEYGIPAASAVLNVFYFEAGGAMSDEDAGDDAADWVTNQWGDAWKNLGGILSEILTWSADTVDTEGHVLHNIGSGLVGLAGLVGSEEEPPAVAAYIKADTEFPKTRGSKYVPGLTEASVDNGYIDGTMLAVMATLLNLYMTAFSGTASLKTWVPGVPSRTLAQFVPFQGTGTITDVPAYQRRRKVNVGS
jgi:hypothetical protein